MIRQFDLKPGDKVYAVNLENNKSDDRRVKYRVIGLYKYIFLAEKLSGSHRQIGFSKADYLTGEVRRA